MRPSMRLIADSILYANDVTPRFNAISIAGAHVRDAGSTAVEEMAYTLANGLAYVDELISRGGGVEKFAKRLSFFFTSTWISSRKSASFGPGADCGRES